MPDEVLVEVRRRYWDHRVNLRGLLSGIADRRLPITINLRPPTGPEALANLNHFRVFVERWREFAHADLVRTEARTLRGMQSQRVPVQLIIPSIKRLAEMMGTSEIERTHRWAERLTQLERLGAAVRTEAIHLLFELETWPLEDITALVAVLDQLRPGMGEGRYLRALPLHGTSTKFVEVHEVIVTRLLDALHAGAVGRVGGLLPWLNCRSKPSDWLILRALCPATRTALGGLDSMRVSTETLLRVQMPGRSLLAVENEQCAYELPELDQTIAVVGTGNNIGWLAAPWVQARPIAYWGDIDTWGYYLLARARELAPQLTSIMMDRETFEAHPYGAAEDTRCPHVFPLTLTADELEMVAFLKAAAANRNRLEQEKIRGDWVLTRLWQWHTQNVGDRA